VLTLRACALRLCFCRVASISPSTGLSLERKSFTARKSHSASKHSEAIRNHPNTVDRPLVARYQITAELWLGDYQLLVASRVAALVVALFGFYFFLTQQNIFASFGAMLFGSCGLLIAFPPMTKWLSGDGTAPERERTVRSKVATTVLATIN
jgi:hypothetical protein